MKKLLLIYCIIFFLLSCKKDRGLSDVQLPPGTAMDDANHFALIMETYISLKDKPGEDGITIAHARRLDILPVEGLEIIRKNENQTIWIHVGEGWVPRSCVQLYSSKEKAVTAAKKLK